MNPARRPERLAAVDAVVALTGLGAGAFGVGVVAVQRGWWTVRDRGEPLLRTTTEQQWREAPERWAVVASVALLVLVAAAVWTVHRLGRSRPPVDVEHRLRVPADRVIDLRDDPRRADTAHEDAGTPPALPVSVTVTSAAGVAAAEAQLDGIDGVRSSHVRRLEGGDGVPTMVAAVEVHDGVPPAEVCDRIDHEVLPGLRRCLGRDDLAVDVHFRVTDRPRPRAR